MLHSLRVRINDEHFAAFVKILWHDSEGMCLLIKRLDQRKFVWPQATSGTVSLTRAQLSMLCEGIDWRHPVRTWQPLMAI